MKINGYVRIGLVGCERTFTLEIDEEEWEEMSPYEQEDYVYEEVQQHVDWGYDRE